MLSYLIEMLECPTCHGTLKWVIIEQNDDRIETADANCTVCGATYPVREGIGVFLTPGLQRNDLWEQVDSGLFQQLRESAEIKHRLMDAPLNTLNPTDQFFRASVLAEQGFFAESQTIMDVADKGLYTSEYLHCRNRQLDYVVERLSTIDGPIVDLASGLGYLVEKVVRELKKPIVASDFSPNVLRKDRKRLASLGLYNQVSLLAFDARSTPFQDRAISTLTTFLGLPNIQDPGNLLVELRRIVAGVFFAVSHFYPEDDGINANVIREAKLDPFMYRRAALQHFSEAGWQVEVKNACVGEAHPTPPSVLFEGVTIDGLPVADTNLEWCTLLASRPAG